VVGLRTGCTSFVVAYRLVATGPVLVIQEQGRIVEHGTYSVVPPGRIEWCRRGTSRGRPAGRKRFEVLSARSAKYLYGPQPINNQRIEDLLNAYAQPPDSEQ
jgi:hypothetical protein